MQLYAQKISQPSTRVLDDGHTQTITEDMV